MDKSRWLVSVRSVPCVFAKHFLVIFYKVGLCSVAYTSKGGRGNRKGIYKPTSEEAGVPLMIIQNSLIILKTIKLPGLLSFHKDVSVNVLISETGMCNEQLIVLGTNQFTQLSFWKIMATEIILDNKVLIDLMFIMVIWVIFRLHIHRPVKSVTRLLVVELDLLCHLL